MVAWWLAHLTLQGAFTVCVDFAYSPCASPLGTHVPTPVQRHVL